MGRTCSCTVIIGVFGGRRRLHINHGRRIFDRFCPLLVFLAGLLGGFQGRATGPPVLKIAIGNIGWGSGPGPGASGPNPRVLGPVPGAPGPGSGAPGLGSGAPGPSPSQSSSVVFGTGYFYHRCFDQP